MGQLLLVRSIDCVPSLSGEGGDALVTNERVGIEPVPLGIEDAPGSIDGGGGGGSTTKLLGLGRSTVFPDALRDEEVLPMDGTVAVCGQPVDDDLRVRVGGGRRQPGGTLRRACDGRVVNRSAPATEGTCSGGDPRNARPGEVRVGVDDLPRALHEAQCGVAELELVLPVGIIA